MAEWEIELEPEVREWLSDLPAEEFGRAEWYVELLAERGRALREPYTRQLDGKLRELRFYLGRSRQRIAYFHAEGRRIVLLTVFHKTKAREADQVRRARKAMEKCIAEGHTPDEDDD